MFRSRFVLFVLYHILPSARIVFRYILLASPSFFFKLLEDSLSPSPIEIICSALALYILVVYIIIRLRFYIY